MLPIATYETYQDGQTIFEEGSHGDWIYAFEAGAVELSKAVEGSRAVITVLQSGDVFGEIAFFARIPRTATARAVGEILPADRAALIDGIAAGSVDFSGEAVFADWFG